VTGYGNFLDWRSNGSGGRGFKTEKDPIFNKADLGLFVWMVAHWVEGNIKYSVKHGYFDAAAPAVVKTELRKAWWNPVANGIRINNPWLKLMLRSNFFRFVEGPAALLRLETWLDTYYEKKLPNYKKDAERIWALKQIVHPGSPSKKNALFYRDASGQKYVVKGLVGSVDWEEATGTMVTGVTHVRPAPDRRTFEQLAEAPFAARLALETWGDPGPNGKWMYKDQEVKAVRVEFYYMDDHKSKTMTQAELYNKEQARTTNLIVHELADVKYQEMLKRREKRDVEVKRKMARAQKKKNQKGGNKGKK
jgi:hypothetical protein